MTTYDHGTEILSLIRTMQEKVSQGIDLAIIREDALKLHKICKNNATEIIRTDNGAIYRFEDGNCIKNHRTPSTLTIRAISYNSATLAEVIIPMKYAKQKNPASMEHQQLVTLATQCEIMLQTINKMLIDHS